jgi:multicomponent Na+:H+ antiporter subunit D
VTDAGLAALLPATVAVPITGAILAPLAAKISRRLPLVIGVISMVATTVLLALPARRVFSGTILVHYLGHVRPTDGHELGVTFAADPFGLGFALLTAGLGAILLLYTLSELRALGARELGGYACLYQLLLAALIGSALTADLFDLFVWFEVAALASFGLTGFFLERPHSLEAALKIVVLTTMAGFGIFIAAALIYSGHGALNFGQIHVALAARTKTADLIALALLVWGFGTKAGLMPFHGWLADAHTACPGPVSALFSGLMVNLGVFALARLALQVYGPAGRPVLGLLMVLGCGSAVVGAVLALGQDNLKRVLAYDTVSQMGVLIVGFSTHALPAVTGATYHLINHAVFKALLFLCAGSIVHATGLEKLSEMGGLARHRPVVAGAFVIGVLAIAGVPPLNGYASLGMIHDELHRSHPVAYVALLVAQVVTIAAMSRATYLAFFRRRERPYDDLDRLHPGMLVAFGALAAACIGFGLIPNLLIDHVAAPAASSLLGGSHYPAGLLNGGGHVAVPLVSFDYFSPAELLTVLGTVIAGLAVATWYVRRAGEPSLMVNLRALHTGSVNDYAAYSTAGLVIATAALALAH